MNSKQQYICPKCRLVTGGHWTHRRERQYIEALDRCIMVPAYICVTDCCGVEVSEPDEVDD
jgi:hypothetical protein